METFIFTKERAGIFFRQIKGKTENENLRKIKRKLKTKVYSSRLRQTTIYDLHQLILRNYIATRISSLILAIRGSDHQLGHVTFGDILN